MAARGSIYGRDRVRRSSARAQMAAVLRMRAINCYVPHIILIIEKTVLMIGKNNTFVYIRS